MHRFFPRPHPAISRTHQSHPNTMSNNCYDPQPDASKSTCFDGLADPFRRRLLTATVIGAGGAALTAAGIPLPSLAAGAGRASGFIFPFDSVAPSIEDKVLIPEGYEVRLLFAWGDPVSDGPRGKEDASDNALEQEQQAGMHHDGLHYFPFIDAGKPSSVHGLLCINHEYTDDGLLHTDGMANWSAEKVRKSKAAHGVSVIEIRKAEDGWKVIRPSRFARRITADTPCVIAGPARGDPAMCTGLESRGETVLGTINNCAMGVTPWGTYLTCEENFNGYFHGSKNPDPDQKRYGFSEHGFGFRWHEFDERFDTNRHPNEVNRFGWVVEIDPFAPDKKPVKRTALGRFKHEGATVTLAKDGRVVVYMGDDERFEYVYKYVSRHPYQAGMTDPGSLLDDGTLHVAHFRDDGSGQWLPLRHGETYAQGQLSASNGFTDTGDIVIRARQAADLAGATKMDRPEWIAVHPKSGEVYITLTNNSQRGKAGNASTNAANPRAGNTFGHILRWREGEADAASLAFEWDIFALAGNPAQADPEGRGNVQGDTYGSPDGLWFDAGGHLWIQTDISTGALNKGAYAGLGNNQMLVADPVSRTTRRFMTGPRQCELTGITTTPDGQTLFVNVQHPGETASERSDPDSPTAISAWPANQFPEALGGRPRSGTVIITRKDRKGILSQR
jgi:uncharacterized protein